jgi:nitrate/nitrite transport system permease protein
VGRALFQGTLLIVILWGFILLLAFILRAKDPIMYTAAQAEHIWQALVRTSREVLTYSDAGKQLSCTLYVTVKGMLMGSFMAAAVGFALGIFPAMVPRCIHAVNALRAIPLTLLLPFLVALPTWLPFPPWLQEYYERGTPEKDPAYLIALGSFLYLVIGIAEGVRHRSTERESVFRRVVGFNRLRYLFLILIPEAMPHVLTAARLATLLSLVLAIVFEQILQVQGIGYLIQTKMNGVEPQNMLVADVLALLFIVALVGVLIDSAFVTIRKQIVTLVGAS